LLTCRQIDVVGRIAGASEHDEMTVAFPKAEDGISAALLHLLEKRFVEREVLRRGGERKIEETK
jgi:hypothetical protein